MKDCVIHDNQLCDSSCIGRQYPPCVDKACAAETKAECRYPRWKMCAFKEGTDESSGIGNLDILKGNPK